MATTSLQQDVIRRRRLAMMGGAWLLLTGITVGLHAATWRMTAGGLSPGAEGAVKHAANITQVFTLPGWLVAKGLRLWLDEAPGAIVASAIGWGMWAGLAWAVLRVRDRGRAIRSRTREPEDVADASRRAFFGRAAATCGTLALGAGAGAAVVGGVVNPLDLRVTRYRIGIRDLPRELEGLTIVQLTDLHLGARVPESVVREAVEMAMGLGADVYALTGDFVERCDSSCGRIGALLAPLAKEAKIGVVGVLGNHDHYRFGDQDWRTVDRVLRAAGVRMVDNGRVFVDTARRLSGDEPERGLCIAGVQDLTEANADVDAALAGVEAGTPRLLLAHNPDVAELRVRMEHRVDLLVCGHTHGGQVRLPVVGSLFVPSLFGDRYRYGLVRGPHCRVLVCAGIGVTVMPVRVGVPPELVHITLEREKA